MVIEEGMIQNVCILVKWAIRSEAPAVLGRLIDQNMGNVHRLSGSGWSMIALLKI